MNVEETRERLAEVADQIERIEQVRDELSHSRHVLQGIPRITAAQGTITLVIGSLYEETRELRKLYNKTRAAMHGGEPLTYQSRGKGANWYDCSFCGTKGSGNGVQTDMAAFVDGKQGGEAVVALFGNFGVKANLDFRPHEPTWVQVKLGACEDHVEILDKIMEHTLFGSIDAEALLLSGLHWG